MNATAANPNPQIDTKRIAGSLSRTQRCTLTAARDAEDSRLGSGWLNNGDGDVNVTAATLRKLVREGLALPIGNTPVAIEITALGREVAEHIRPYVPGPSKFDQLAAILNQAAVIRTGIDLTTEDVANIVEVYQRNGSVAQIADWVNVAWRRTDNRSEQNHAIDAAVAIRDILAGTDLI